MKSSIAIFILCLFSLLSYQLYSQSSVHYIGPVHSNQKNTLFAKEQYIYVTSPHKGGKVYIKIKKYGLDPNNPDLHHGISEIFSIEEGRSFSYKVGDDDESALVITTSDLGKNLNSKGMIVEGFQDQALTLPAPIFVETRFQAGNYDADPQTQYTSWNTINGFTEPNDCCSSSSNEENYAHIWFNGLWNDLPNDRDLQFIVEFDYNINNIGNGFNYLGQFDGHSYFISTTYHTWLESREISLNLGGYLVSINTQEEQNKIMNWFDELQVDDEEWGPWIGLFQDPSDPLYFEPVGGWRWDDGSSLNYYERQQANSSFLKGESAPGKLFRLGHGINNIKTNHRRVFVTFFAVDEGITNVTLGDLGEGWEHIIGDGSDYEIDEAGNYKFSFSQHNTHAFALDNVQSSPDANLDALVGALVTSDKNIVVNVGFWGGSNSWQGAGRDIGFDQIKPFDNVSNEYVFLRAAGDITVNGQRENTNEYAVVVAHQDNTKLWLHTSLEDTAGTAPNYVLNAGEYQKIYFGEFGNSTFYSGNQIYMVSNNRVYGYQNMAGHDGAPTKQAMMLVNGVNPMASSKIDGIYNIEDIAGTKFEMQLKILTSTGADLYLNGLKSTNFNPQKEVIYGKEELSWYLFDNNDLENILPLGPDKRLTIESDGPLYGQYYGYNAVQGLAGYFFSYSDFDKDGITDADDWDDDNDGILDVWEMDEDLDGDGLINRYDLDSDNDGCSDAVEAGYTDQDGNGILGFGETYAVIVDSKGRVIKNEDQSPVIDGYTLPDDLNGNGVYDFREKGIQAEIIKHPEDIIIEPCQSLEDIFFEVGANGNALSYKWRVSRDNGVTWEKVSMFADVNSFSEKRFEIYDADSTAFNYLFRAVVETPGFKCGTILYSEPARIIKLPDNDNDCVTDDIDLDDDNDGILDTKEDSTDLDGDGIINSFDLDSDGDGCFDVIEGGYYDGDGDGIAGDNPVLVDSLGRVIADSTNADGTFIYIGYSTENDLDNNGVPDYRELSSSPTVTVDPVSVEVPVDLPTSFEVSTDFEGSITYQWQMNLGEGWINLSENSTYSGVNSNKLVIDSVLQIMDGTLFRVLLTSAVYCTEDAFSNPAQLKVMPDNDRDRIPDVFDIDDDNDGILDIDESTGDTDSDGIINSFDLDSDGDGCLDVIEAGYDDGDGDGLLGLSDVEVDSLGKVISSSSGYSDPLDRDGNGVKDFLEIGSEITILSNPFSVSIIETRNARYEINVQASGTIEYQWQYSEDNGINWFDTEDDEVYSGSKTSTLILTNAPLEFNDYQFKVKVSTPTYVCDEDIFSSVALTVLPDNDKDGIADEDDLDDDNDGILDIYEIEGLDSDGDGVVNTFDLDSDGDGCNDVNEGSCLDSDEDGLVGSNPFNVDGLGRYVEKYVAHYDFSGNADDKSGNNLHGVVNGASLVKDRFGIPNSAYYFDGVNDNIVVPHDSLLNIGIYEDFIISMWIKPSENFMLGNNNSILKKVSADSSWNYQYKVDGDTSTFNFNVSPSEITYNESLFPLNSGQWYYLTIMKEQNRIVHFVDGDTIFSYIDSTRVGINNEDMVIGGSSNGADWFEGVIDDIVIAKGCDQLICRFGEPYDSDNSGVYDFLEPGGPVSYDSISESEIITELTSTEFKVYSSGISKVFFEWQISNDGGLNWQKISESSVYSGTNTDKLTLNNTPLSLSGVQFRVILTTPSFKCGEIQTSELFALTVLPDNDVDGIPDSIDLDDDNDGILDSEEGTGDVDNDGIQNQFDLDSDGDGCFDVIEASFSDTDNDGILGDDPVVVNEDGLVISADDGYTDPVDRDGNLVADYLDFGSFARIIVEPSDIHILERSDTSVTVIADVKEGITKLYYLWQVSENGGITWEGISNDSEKLTIINADPSFNDRIYRVIVSTPSFICGEDVVSDPFKILVLGDFDYDLVGDFVDVDDDNDGIYDSIECFNSSILQITGDYDSSVSASYPLVLEYEGEEGSGSGNNVFGDEINIKLNPAAGDVYEGCFFESDITFDDGLNISVDGKTILSFNQYHWDVGRGKANSEITREFRAGGIFSGWVPWNEKTDILLVIRDGSIKLLSETVDGKMIDVIPYMDNTVEGWVLDKNFDFSCLEGVSLSIKNTNHDGPSGIKSKNTVYAYVCSDTDSDLSLDNKDLDSDNDECFDVIEAGFTDYDENGFLGIDPITVDSVGKVTSGGYEFPLDNDKNGVMDYIEPGFSVNITSTPESSYLIKEGDTFSISYEVDFAERFVYQWQVQEFGSLFWENIQDTVTDRISYTGTNTNTLNVEGVRFDDMQVDNIFLKFRLVISTPSFICQDDIFTSPTDFEIYHRDLHIPNGFSPNNDGINDFWIIRGIEGYPNNKLRVYNRWNNRVFERKGYKNNWDGRNQMQIYFGNGELPEATYFYILDLGDGSKPYTGFVYIKR